MLIFAEILTKINILFFDQLQINAVGLSSNYYYRATIYRFTVKLVYKNNINGIFMPVWVQRR